MRRPAGHSHREQRGAIPARRRFFGIQVGILFDLSQSLVFFVRKSNGNVMVASRKYILDVLKTPVLELPGRLLRDGTETRAPCTFRDIFLPLLH